MNRSFCLVRSALALNSRIASCALEPRASVLFQLPSSRSARQRGFSSEGGTEDSLHSSDIAFKPAESGWGAGKKYAQNFDTIFSQIQKTTKQANDTTTPTTSYPPCKEGELA